MVKTFKAGRRLRIFGVMREPGELVPEAHDWLRVDNSVHTGYLKEVEVSEPDFRKAVAIFAPERAEMLCAKAGITPGVQLTGAHRSPREQVSLRKAPASATSPLQRSVALKDKPVPAKAETTSVPAKRAPRQRRRRT